MLAGSIISNLVADSSETLVQVRCLISDALQLGCRESDLTEATLLLGNLPELDSMAVVTVISALEEHFHFVTEDDDDLAEAFESLGSLSQYVSEKSKKR